MIGVVVSCEGKTRREGGRERERVRERKGRRDRRRAVELGAARTAPSTQQPATAAAAGDSSSNRGRQHAAAGSSQVVSFHGRGEGGRAPLLLLLLLLADARCCSLLARASASSPTQLAEIGRHAHTQHQQQRLANNQRGWQKRWHCTALARQRARREAGRRIFEGTCPQPLSTRAPPQEAAEARWRRQAERERLPLLARRSNASRDASRGNG